LEENKTAVVIIMNHHLQEHWKYQQHQQGEGSLAPIETAHLRPD
jgi:hypothetical protein